MSRSLSQTGEAKRRFSWPTGTPQIVALLLVLLVDSPVAPHFPDRRAGWPAVW